MRVSFPILCILALAPCAARSEELTGQQIMEKARNNGRGQDAQIDLLMTIQNGKSDRVREMRSYTKKYDDIDKSLMRFLSPSDVKGSGLLVWGQKDRADDQWIYLPELRRTKKIAASTRNGSFMGSDFSYYDMEDRSPEEGNHTLTGTEACGDAQCYVVESVEKSQEDAVYSKSVSWIRQDNFVPVKMELYDKKGEHFKTATFENYEKIKEIWIARKVTMSNLKKNTKTTLEIKEVKINEGLGDNYFTQRYLEKEE